MLRALTPEIRANSSNRYSANAMHPDYATGALRLCTATMHATTVAVAKSSRAKSCEFAEIFASYPSYT